MAKIISLGCDVAEIYHLYSKVHSSLFGPQSYRLVVAALTRKEGYAYVNCESSLEELQGRLAGLVADISGLEKVELSSRAASELRQGLLEYTQSLQMVMARLKGICHQLVEDKMGYRDASSMGHSRFNQDKVEYDRSIQHLERTGRRLNKLFSSY